MNIKEFFEKNKNVAVAFSGGVDSSALLLLAKKYAENVKAYYVKSDFQPRFEYEDALSIAETLGVDLKVITVDVLSDEKIADNSAKRCYYCKKRIFESIIKEARKDGLETVLDGTNASDDISDRPGFKALKEMGVLSPLKECNITKSEIRKLARENRLIVAEKPSYACLATRIPTGVPITKELLEKTEQAENRLFDLGFKNFRIRYLDGAAKLELGKNEVGLFNSNPEKIKNALSPFYRDIYLDLKERTDE
jgi:uncharacterized protein